LWWIFTNLGLRFSAANRFKVDDEFGLPVGPQQQSERAMVRH